MAYLDLASPNALFPSLVSTKASTFERKGLASAERSAVMLARSDSASSVAGVTYWHKVATFAFGLRRANKLADIRLETLRRFAVATAHNRPRLAAWEANELRLLRFSEQAIEEASQLAEQFRRPKSMAGWIYAAFATLMIAAFLYVRSSLGDDIIAAIAVALAGIPLFVAVAPRNVQTTGSH